MDIKIISFLKEESIILSNSEVNIKCVEKEVTKHYYKLDNSKIEIIYLDKLNISSNEKIVSYLSNKKTVKNIILLDENSFINKEVKKKLIMSNCLFIIRDKLQGEFILNDKIKILGLEKDGLIDVSLILFGLLKSEDITFLLKNIDIDTIILGREKDNLIGNLVLSILKRLSYINKAKEINLFLYLRDEFNLQDLTYIEDPLKEYINNKLCLNIKQKNSEIIHNELYFSLININ